jgi:hypothetical protein
MHLASERVCGPRKRRVRRLCNGCTFCLWVNVEAHFCKAIINFSECYLYICLYSTVYYSVGSCIPTRSLYQKHTLQYTGYCNTVGSVDASPPSRNETAGGLINSLNICVVFLSEFHANSLCIVWQCVKQVTAACSYKVRQLPAAKYQGGTLDRRLV